MGYRGKLAEQARARELRANGLSLLTIAEQLGVSKSSVSLWVRDLAVAPPQRRRAVNLRMHPQRAAKLAEIDELDRRGVERLGVLSEQAFLAAGAALYAGEGAKRDGKIVFANTDASMVAFFCAWLRRFFSPDESRLRVRVYLHDGLDLEAAERYWAGVTKVPRDQFLAAHRATADATTRRTKHEHGCAYVIYNCSRTHREIMGLIRALLSCPADPG